MSFRVKQIKFQPRLQDIGEGLSGQVHRGDLRLISGFSTWGLLFFASFHPSEKTSLRVLAGDCTARPSPMSLPSWWRGGLRTPVNETLLASEDRPIGPPGFRLPLDDYVVPRHEYGLATRARRPRPSEKKSPSASARVFPVRPS